MQPKEPRDAWLWLLGFLLVLGLVGRLEYEDQQDLARLTVELRATAPAWEVTK
jgi:hypothetical protein